MKKGFILGLTTGVVITGASLVLANSQIQAILNDQIKVTLNGQIQEFKDETTNETQYPITYHDRTYLPLRTVANLVGVDVDYDTSSNTAILKDNKSSGSFSDIYFNALSKLDYTNSLKYEDWEVSADGTTIKPGFDSESTNFSAKIKSLRVTTGQTHHFWLLTEEGKIYVSYSSSNEFKEINVNNTVYPEVPIDSIAVVNMGHEQGEVIVYKKIVTLETGEKTIYAPLSNLFADREY